MASSPSIRRPAISTRSWSRRNSGAATSPALLLDDAKRLSPARLDLQVNKDNARAIAFYEKHGFVMAGEGVNPVSGRPVYGCAGGPDHSSSLSSALPPSCLSLANTAAVSRSSLALAAAGLLRLGGLRRRRGDGGGQQRHAVVGRRRLLLGGALHLEVEIDLRAQAERHRVERATGSRRSSGCGRGCRRWSTWWCRRAA